VSSSKESIGNTLFIAVAVSLVCSVLVASAAIVLRPQQLKNEEEFRQRIIVGVAGFDLESADLATLFAKIEPRLVDLETGEYVDSPSLETFDAAEAANSAELGLAVPTELDIAGVRRRAKYGLVYLVKEGDAIRQIILPVHGAGLWSTMYGYLALENDASTIRGLQFYAHGETPGLGDQIDKPAWRAQWAGRKLIDESGAPAIEVIKGTVDRSSPDAQYQVDGLAGATLTARGVTNLVHYWVGEHGYGPYLDRRRQEAQR